MDALSKAELTVLFEPPVPARVLLKFQLPIVCENAVVAKKVIAIMIDVNDIHL